MRLYAGTTKGTTTMIWIFASVVLVLACTIPKFRKVLLWTSPIWGFALILILAPAA